MEHVGAPFADSWGVPLFFPRSHTRNFPRRPIMINERKDFMITPTKGTGRNGQISLRAPGSFVRASPAAIRPDRAAVCGMRTQTAAHVCMHA